MLEVLAPFASKPHKLSYEQCFGVELEVPTICAESSDLDLNDWILAKSINSSLLISNHCPPIPLDQTFSKSAL
jgi:hypothetical protein